MNLLPKLNFCKTLNKKECSTLSNALIKSKTSIAPPSLCHQHFYNVPDGAVNVRCLPSRYAVGLTWRYYFMQYLFCSICKYLH